jgi:hypothetical protein
MTTCPMIWLYAIGIFNLNPLFFCVQIQIWIRQKFLMSQIKENQNIYCSNAQYGFGHHSLRFAPPRSVVHHHYDHAPALSSSKSKPPRSSTSRVYPNSPSPPKHASRARARGSNGARGPLPPPLLVLVLPPPPQPAPLLRAPPPGVDPAPRSPQVLRRYLLPPWFSAQFV